MWFNAKVDPKTGQVIASYAGRISDRPHANNHMRQNTDDSLPNYRFEN
jgi:hypothetical protein